MLEKMSETSKEQFIKHARERLHELALCPSASTILFDQIEHNEYSEAAQHICSRCQVAEECLLIVNPTNSYFDGVAGGIVFKNGVIVPKQQPKPRFRERSL